MALLGLAMIGVIVGAAGVEILHLHSPGLVAKIEASAKEVARRLVTPKPPENGAAQE